MKRLLLSILFIAFITTINIYAKDKTTKKDSLKIAKRDSLVNVFFKSARIDNQLDNLVETFGKYNSSSQIKLEDYTEISRIMQRSFIKDTIANIIKLDFKKNYDEQYIIKVTNWLNSPFAQKLFSLDTKTNFDTLSPEQVQYMMVTLPKTGRTINMVREMCKATGVADLTTELIINYLKSFMIAINPKLPKDKQIGPNEMNSRVYEFSKTMKTYMQLAMEMIMYYKYKDLSYPEYQEFISFYNSPQGNWYTRTLSEGLKKAFVNATDKFTKELTASDIILKLSEK